MWICLNDAFISIVEDRDDDGYLLVRARVKGHLETLFSQKVTVTPNADYRYRVRVPREDVARIIQERIEHIDYDNFKASVKNRALHDAYMAFWAVMLRVQEKTAKVVSAPYKALGLHAKWKR